MKTMVAISVALLAACGPGPVPTQAELTAATASVWWGTYRAAADWEPPPITIAEQKCLDLDPSRLAPGQEPACADGFYEPTSNTVTIGWWTQTIDQSSLAHELYHAFGQRRDHDDDAMHVGRGWGILVPDAEAALRDAGL